MNLPGYSCEILDIETLFTKYESSWHQLHGLNSMAEPCTAYEWIKPVYKHLALKKHPTIALLLKKEEQIIGIIPLVLYQFNKLGIKINILEPISEFYFTHSDLLIYPISQENILYFLNSLKNLSLSWDIFHMRAIPEKHSYLALLVDGLKNQKINYSIQPKEVSFYLTLNTSYPEFLQKRSRKFRKNLNLIRNRIINDHHTYHFKTLSDIKDINQAYEILLTIEQLSWKHLHGTAISSASSQTQLYKDLCESFYEHGNLKMLFLFIDDQPVAYDFGVLCGQKYHDLKCSFHQDYQKYSPSTLIRAKLIENLIQENISCIDFGPEAYEYITHWTDENQIQYQVRYYRNNSKGQLYYLYDCLKSLINKIKPFFKQSALFRDPKALKTIS